MDTGDRRDRVRQLVRARHVSILVVLAVSVGCDSGSPGGPSPLATPVPAALGISSVSPTTGSTEGGTSVTVSGSGFEAGTVVVLDGVRSAASVENSLRAAVHDRRPRGRAADRRHHHRRPGDPDSAAAGSPLRRPAQSFDFNGT